MAGSKLFDREGPRTEDLQWNPPVLKFQIERHGGRVLGSTRVELQTWEINVIQATAGIVATGRRQLEPMDARLDVNPLASETAKMIVDGHESPRLKWSSPTRVRIVSGEVIPATNKQTTAGRRKRFGAALEKLLGREAISSLNGQRRDDWPRGRGVGFMISAYGDADTVATAWRAALTNSSPSQWMSRS